MIRSIASQDLNPGLSVAKDILPYRHLIVSTAVGPTSLPSVCHRILTVGALVAWVAWVAWVGKISQCIVGKHVCLPVLTMAPDSLIKFHRSLPYFSGK